MQVDGVPIRAGALHWTIYDLRKGGVARPIRWYDGEEGIESIICLLDKVVYLGEGCGWQERSWGYIPTHIESIKSLDEFGMGAWVCL